MNVYFYTTDLHSFNQIAAEGDLLGQTRGLQCWIHLTSHYLQKHSSSVVPVITDTVPDEGVVVFHKGHFPPEMTPGPGQFFICVQADYGRHRFAQMHVVQNPCQVSNIRASKKGLFDRLFDFSATEFIPLWPQPGLLPRMTRRNSEIRNIGFLGNAEQFPLPSIDSLDSEFAKRGLHFVARLEPQQWHDYREVDIVLAIRSFSQAPFWHKPFSKLVNAILSGSLVIAGRESSAMYFKKHYYPQLPVVSSERELLGAIDYIQNDPGQAFYDLAICRSQLTELQEDQLVKRWEFVLDESQARFAEWRNAPHWKRKLYTDFRTL